MRTAKANATTGNAIAEPPPRDDELAWMSDRALSVSERIEVGFALFVDVKDVMKALMARGVDGRPGVSAAASQWNGASVAVLGRLAEVMARELVPTLDPNDPTYAARVEGVTKIGMGGAGMLAGSLLMMQDGGGGNLWVRREHIGTWARNIRSFTFVWTPEQCRDLSQQVSTASSNEKDVEIVRSLHEIRDVLAACSKAN